MINPKRYARLSAGDRSVEKPLTEFSVFPKLPTEIRSRIFQFAARQENRGRRMIHVEAYLWLSDPDFGLYFQFNILKSPLGEFEGIHKMYRTKTGTVLLCTCRESRVAFQQVFPNRLPALEFQEPVHNIHFDDETMIFIENIADICLQSNTIYQNCRRQDLFENIKHLAVDIIATYHSVNWIETLDVFKNLSYLLGIEVRDSNTSLREHWRTLVQPLSRRRKELKCEILIFGHKTPEPVLGGSDRSV